MQTFGFSVSFNGSINIFKKGVLTIEQHETTDGFKYVCFRNGEKVATATALNVAVTYLN